MSLRGTRRAAGRTASLVAGGWMLAAGSAAAGSTVVLPDQPGTTVDFSEVDFSERFVISGKAQREVFALFVRTSWLPFDTHQPARSATVCRAVAALVTNNLGLGALEQHTGSAVDFHELLREPEPAQGTPTTAEAQVEDARKATLGRLTLVARTPASFVAKKEKGKLVAQPFELAVDAGWFLRPGSDFCIAIVEPGLTKEDDEALRKTVEGAFRNRSTEPGDAGTFRSVVDAFVDSSGLSAARFSATLQAIWKPEEANELPGRLRALADELGKAAPFDAGPGPSDALALRMHDPLPLDRPGLGRVAAEILVRRGDLERSDNDQWAVPGEEVRVEALRLHRPAGRDATDAATTLLLPVDGSAPRRLELDLSALQVEGLDITLGELARWLEGRVPDPRGAGHWVAWSELARPDGASESLWGEVTDPDVLAQDSARARLSRSLAAIDEVLGTVTLAGPRAPRGTPVGRLARWLEGWDPAFVGRHLGAPNADRLFEITDESSAFQRLAVGWTTAKTRLVTTATIATTKLRAVEAVPIGVNRADTFFENYMTPRLGVAVVGLGSRVAVQPAVFLSLSPAPNLVSEPMWSNGLHDAARVPSIAVGVGLPETGAFPQVEADSRIAHPPDALPPLLLGLQLQVMPYTTVCAGAAVLGVRHTRLSGERPDLQVRPFLSLNVELNAVGAIRGLIKHAGRSQ